MVKSKIALSVVLASVLYSSAFAVDSKFDADGGSVVDSDYVGDGGKVTISTGATQTENNVYGKKENSTEEVSGVEVEMSGGQIKGFLIGTYNDGAGAVSGSKVTITDDGTASVGNVIYGGQSKQGDTTNNHVTITGEAPDSADAKLPSNDKLNFQAFQFIAGGAAGSNYTDIVSGKRNSKNNRVTLTNVGTHVGDGAAANYGVSVAGGFGSGEVSGNKVNIKNSYISAYMISTWAYPVAVAGGFTSDNAENGEVYGNEVTIDNSTIGRGVAGGFANSQNSSGGVSGKVVVSG